jgi:hypothetical protein
MKPKDMVTTLAEEDDRLAKGLDVWRVEIIQLVAPQQSVKRENFANEIPGLRLQKKACQDW